MARVKTNKMDLEQNDRLIEINKHVNRLCTLSHQWFKELKDIHKECFGEKISIKEMKKERDDLVESLKNEAMCITKNISHSPIEIPAYLQLTNI